MKKYEYKFVEVTRKTGLKVKVGDSFEECKQVIMAEAEQGWRLKQVVTPFNEKEGFCQVTFKELSKTLRKLELDEYGRSFYCARVQDKQE